MFFHGTDPSSSRTLPPLAPTSGDLVSLLTHTKGTPVLSRAAAPWQCGAITQPRPPEGSAHAFRSQASVNEGLSVSFCGEIHLGFGSPDQGFLWPPLTLACDLNAW